MHPALLKVQRALQHVERSVGEFIRRSFSGRPRAVALTAGALGIGLFFAAGWTAYFAYDLTTGLPTREQLRGIGDMVQATTIFDSKRSARVHDLQGTTQRDPARPHVGQFHQRRRFGGGSAVLRSRRCRRRPGWRRRHPQPARRAARRGREHDYAAARAPDVPQPRQDLSAEAARDHDRRLPRESLHEAGDSRDVPQQGLLRRRPLRCRSGGARLLRQARRGSAGR